MENLIVLLICTNCNGDLNWVQKGFSDDMTGYYFQTESPNSCLTSLPVVSKYFEPDVTISCHVLDSKFQKIFLAIEGFKEIERK